MSTPEDRDYVVGTHDAEIERTDFRQFAAQSGAPMLTPTVLEVLAVKE